MAEKGRDEILSSEYSGTFDEMRKNRMITSYYKYGPIAENYGHRLVDAIKNLEIRLDLYKKTGNTEFLLDVANFAMIEYLYPQHPEAHFKAADSDASPGLGSITYRDMQQGI